MVVNVATNRYGVAKFIVAPTIAEGANYTSIANAITDAASGDTIFIRPGTYTENLTLKAGVSLCSFSGEGLTPTVTITGKITATFSGRASIAGIRCKTNGDYLLESTGANSFQLLYNNCFFDAADFTAFHVTNSSANITIVNSQGNLGTTGIHWFTMTAGSIAGRYTFFFNTNNSTSVEDIGGSATLGLLWCHLRTGVNTSGTAIFEPKFCTIQPPSNVIPYQQDSTGTSIFTMCDVAGTNTTTEAIQINSGTTRVWNSRIEGNGTYNISGTGQLVFDHFDGGNVTVSLDPGLTVVKRKMYAGSIQLGQDVEILSGSGSPNGVTTALKGSLFLRTDGSSTSTRAYINTNGGTTWTAITTVA